MNINITRDLHTGAVFATHTPPFPCCHAQGAALARQSRQHLQRGALVALKGGGVARLQLGAALGECEEVELPLDLLERLAARLGDAAVGEGDEADEDERKREEAKAAEGGGDGEEDLADDEVGESVALRRERRAHRALVYGEELSGEQPRDRPHADAE